MKKKNKRVIAASMAMMLAATSAAAVPVMAKTTSDEVSEREARNAELSMNLATQGMVLLENQNDALPIADSGNIALFGGGAYTTIKGGTGSGDVNQRNVVNVWDGFVNAGYNVTSTDWLNAFGEAYEEGGGSTGGVGGASLVPDIEVTDAQIEAAKAGGTDTAVYVIARSSGEFADRKMSDYYLTDIEKANIAKMAANFENSIVVLNVGGIMDTKFFAETEGLDSMLLMSQAGMRGGDAVVKVLNGEVTPSGKLTDTWAVNYEDYSSSETFGVNDGDDTQENYTDDIYVGYRYFDTFNVTPAYEFGYGMSYTDFAMYVTDVSVDAENVTVTVRVTNIGDTYSGKEVVQVYFSAPDGELEKPYQELAAFGKTDELAPGESQTLALSYNTTEMSSYSMEQAAYIMEAGDYVVRVGNSSRNTAVAAVVSLDETCTTEQLSNQMVQDEDMDVLSNEGVEPYSYDGEAEQIAAAPRFEIAAADVAYADNASEYDDESVVSYVYEDSDYETVDQTANPRYTKEPSGSNTTPSQLIEPYEETIQYVEKTVDNPTLLDVYQGTVSMEEFLASLTPEEMSYIVEGIGWGGSNTPIVGAQANSVQGAAGETTSNYYETRTIPNIVLADGPAGIRITQQYEDDGQTYYQYCTAFPIGTLIAQSWDREVARQFGEAIGEEMTEMGVTMWLAPGMNIHRNPLCGRNFEYYSEDPFIAGMTAATVTTGVQSYPGIGVTLKHYAGNNQEDNRNAVNNTITERALREIYLKGFEIAVKAANPMGIMTSYNLNNAWPAADDYDLCTDIPRGEWGFNGLIMTDWGGGQSTPVNSMHAGNDLIMPGGSSASIRQAVEDVAPDFTDDGYVTVTQGWGSSTENWNDFVLDPEGDTTLSVEVTADAVNAKVQEKIDEGVASISTKTTADGTKTYVEYTGYYEDNNTLPLGDLQKAARNVLNVIMDSTQFVKIGQENGVDVEIGAFTQNAGLDSYNVLAKSEVEETLSTSVLEYALELAASADTEGVIPAVADRFNAAVANGQAVLDRVYAGDYTVTQAMVDQSWHDILMMMQYLSFEQGDKSDLEAVINMAEGLDLGKYIESTVEGFEEALTAANDVYADENAMQDDVDQAWRTLLKEMSEMRLTPDKDALAALIQSASGLNESAYEAESFALMRTALAAAEDVYADENATEEEVQTAVSDLQSALAALVKAAPAADDTTAAEDNNAAATDSKDIDGTLTAGVTSSNNTSGSSTAGTKTAGTTSVKTGDTANTTTAMAAMIGALAVIGLAATTIVSRKRR